jgi:hypothetical protein
MTEIAVATSLDDAYAHKFRVSQNTFWVRRYLAAETGLPVGASMEIAPWYQSAPDKYFTTDGGRTFRRYSWCPGENEPGDILLGDVEADPTRIAALCGAFSIWKEASECLTVVERVE